jgi:hypothetical protein
MESFSLVLFTIMFIKLCFSLCMFLCLLTLMWAVAFLYFASCPSYATLSHAGLFEVPVTYLGSLGYFSAWGPVLPYDCPLKRLLLMGGPVYAVYLA